jgi:hypothetical protein
MLDHINWYLVELERKLRNKRTAQATTDMLVEAKSHLEEHAAELVAKGVDPATASKAAVADFGDPGSVVQAYSGSATVAKATYGLWVALASGLLSMIVVALYLWVFDPIQMTTTSTAWVIWLPWLSLPIVAWAGFRFRRWIALPVGAIALLFAVAAGSWVVSNSELMQLGGQTRMVYLPMVERQIDLRQQWLTRAIDDFAILQEWRTKRASPEGDDLLKKLAVQSHAFVVPTPYWNARWNVVPSDYSRPVQRFTPYVDDYRPGGFGITQSPDFKYARETWLANGDKYAEFLKKRITDITKEVSVLGSIRPQAWSEKWGTIGFAPIPMVGAASLVLLVLNGLAISASSLLATSRRQRWRRQLG